MAKRDVVRVAAMIVALVVFGCWAVAGLVTADAMEALQLNEVMGPLFGLL